MSSPYVGEIRQFAGNFAPVGWMFCNGQIVSISEYEVLFTLIGTTYGGNGTTTFALPDLQGRVPIHMNASYPIGAKAGLEQVTLTPGQIPNHTHQAHSSGAAGTGESPANSFWANTTNSSYAPPPASLAMNNASISSTGGNLSHDNMTPYLAVSYIISLYGIYPSQS